jgi:hypothetical protein
MRHRIQRAHFRIPYPMQARPRVVVPGEQEVQHEVIDLCERGIRFAATREQMPRVGSEFRARIVFPRGVEVSVEGEVIRLQDGQVAVHLTRQGVPLGVIYDEQRFLRARFPVWVDERFRQSSLEAVA